MSHQTCRAAAAQVHALAQGPRMGFLGACDRGCGSAQPGPFAAIVSTASCSSPTFGPFAGTQHVQVFMPEYTVDVQSPSSGHLGLGASYRSRTAGRITFRRRLPPLKRLASPCTATVGRRQGSAKIWQKSGCFRFAELPSNFTVSGDAAKHQRRIRPAEPE